MGVALASLPAPFGDVAPVRSRAALAVVLAAVVVTTFGTTLPITDLGPMVIAKAALGEVLVGGVMGLTVRATLAVAETAGTLVGQASGLGFAGSVDPTLGEEVLPTTRLLSGLGAVIFFSMNGHHMVIQALAATVRAAPPGDALRLITSDGILGLGAQLVAHALRIAAPVVATMFVVQLGTALVARAAPRVQLFALSFGVAASVGFVALFVAAPTMASAISAEVGRLPDALAASLSLGTP